MGLWFVINNNKFGKTGFFDDATGQWDVLPENPIDVAALLGSPAHSVNSLNSQVLGSGSGNPAHGSGNSGGSTTTTGTTTATTATLSSLTINVTWDSSVASAPSGFTTAVMTAVRYLERRFSDPVNVNIHVGYGEVAGSTLPSGALGESRWSLISKSYSQLLSALTLDAKTASDAAAVASLPASSPVSGTFWTTTAQAKALGLLSPTNTAVDGYVGFSSKYAFDYSDSNGVSAGSYDFESIVLHEVTEVLGRALLTGGTIGGTSPSYSAGDLFHYSSPGVRDFSASTAGYFSINGGTTNLDPFNTNSGGDAGDWGSGAGSDAFNAFSASGVINSISNADLTVLDAIGWDRTAVGASAPIGVTVSPVTASLAGLQISSGLAANKQLASGLQTGGYSIDKCNYTLGGAGAAPFTLSTTNDLATLTTGGAGVPGASNGRLYALTVTVTDTTDGLSSPAVPLDIIVGSSGTDAINVSALVGATQAATPTFIYGLAGNDAIDASGMTGNLWINGGSGADILTGGSGSNDYLYGATSDSLSSAVDVITNFNAAADLIDLSGLGTKLLCVGAISGTSLNAQSVGWQQSGGNTFIYVDTTTASQTLGATSMAIELQGTPALSSANILHH